MKPRLCAVCGHPIEGHSHMVPHPCKCDGCICQSYATVIVTDPLSERSDTENV